jgi:hypothetical protein
MTQSGTHGAAAPLDIIKAVRSPLTNLKFWIARVVWINLADSGDVVSSSFWKYTAYAPVTRGATSLSRPII